MHGAWGDLVGFNFLVRYEYKYKPKDIRSPFIYKHMYSFLPVLAETYLSLKYSTHPSIHKGHTAARTVVDDSAGYYLN